MTWVLYVCTSGWVLCGSLRQIEYPSEASCYSALESMYRLQGKDAFNYVLCKPKEIANERD